MRIIYRYVVGLVVLFVSQAALAVDYKWHYKSNVTNPGFDTPTAACEDAARRSGSGRTGFLGSSKTSPSGSPAFECYIKYANGNSSRGDDVIRYGDSCPADHTYNAGTGVCEPNEPEPPKDCSNVSPGIFRTPDGPVITINGRRFVASRLEGPVCYDGCEYDITRTVSCYLVPGSSDTGFCNALGQGNGNNCSSTDAALGSTGDQLNPPSETPDPDEPPSDPNDPGCPDGYSWSGTTCVKTPPGDGGDNGGDGGDNGGSNGGNNGGGNNGGGDGGGDNGGSTGGGDGGGNGNGDGDGNSGGSTGGGNGNGNGSGNGSGDGDGDGEGSGGPGGGGVPGVCEDGVCQFEPPEGFGDGEVPGFGESLEQVFKGIQESPIGQAVTSISFPSGGTCPVSSVSLLNTSITFDSHCDLWGQIAPILSAVFLAVWALLAVRIFLSA